MYRNLYKLLNHNKPKIREFDPSTVQRIKEGAYLVKMISETEVAFRKCEFYAGNCLDQEIANFFKVESNKLKKAKHSLENYFESITKE